MTHLALVDSRQPCCCYCWFVNCRYRSTSPRSRWQMVRWFVDTFQCLTWLLLADRPKFVILLIRIRTHKIMSTVDVSLMKMGLKICFSATSSHLPCPRFSFFLCLWPDLHFRSLHASLYLFIYIYFFSYSAAWKLLSDVFFFFFLERFN